MRTIDYLKKSDIIQCINNYYDYYGTTPSVREISAETGISVATVHRYLKLMNDSNEIKYNGRRSLCTERISLESMHHSIAVKGYVACGPGEEELEEDIEYIRMPESLIGKGEFFALIAKGESMIDVGISDGDYVVIRKQVYADKGDIVVALYEGKNNLKLLDFDKEKMKYILKSCNQDKEKYSDIFVEAEELRVQGVAVSVTHKLRKLL